ncbi:jg24012 [Pararge aegeria aegeria]|uniref:Jg24012 protein n=7 Tax=Pararge aegeria TaxID=116150 RepID=A0A8S4SAU9_9NEOP|nr:jg24012 [Pararge aegeria aegeria]
MTQDSVLTAEPSTAKAQVNHVESAAHTNGDVEVRVNGKVGKNEESPAKTLGNAEVQIQLVNGDETSLLQVPGNRGSLLHPATKKP